MGNITTRKLSAGSRVYYFDLCRDSKGQPYMSISEIPTDRSPKGKKRQRIFVHAEKIEEFVQALSEVTEQIKNEVKG